MHPARGTSLQRQLLPQGFLPLLAAKQDGTTADQSKADSGAQDSSQKDSAKTGQFYLFKAKTDYSGKATKVTKVSNKQGYQMDMKLFSDDNKALVYGTSTSSATQFDLRVSAVDGSGTKVLDATVQYKHVVAVY